MNKNRKIIPILLTILFMMSCTSFTPYIYADSNENLHITKLNQRENTSTIKCWTIEFKTPVDLNSILKPGIITVKDSQGNLMNIKISTGNSGKYVYVDPPKEGYKVGQTYYLNISKDITFEYQSRSLKNGIQIKFTTGDIGSIDIDETTSIVTTNNTFAFNLMENLISQDKTEVILINSLCLKGKWEDQFLTENTKKEEFNLSNGNKINIDTMQNTSYVNYLEESNFQTILLSYHDNMEMDIFLPKKDININEFSQNITKDNFDKWMNNFKSTYVLQQIPKFKMYYDTDLNNPLKALGIFDAFDPEKADFKKLVTNNTLNQTSLYINKIKHKAYISVDEEGTEAAAVTVEIMNGTSAPYNKPIYFKADRPFFFIGDNKTGIISFMGKMDNPSTPDIDPAN